MSSIRRQLLLRLLAGLMLGLVVATAAVYRQAREEANALFDYQLQQMASSLPNEAFGPLQIPPVDSGDSDDEVVVQIWNRDGTQLYFSRPESRLPERAEIGFSTVTTPRGQWRVYSALIRNNVVQVAQPMSLRQELAAKLALRTVVPLLLLLPLLAGAIWFTVGHGLRPLRRVAGELGERSPAALHPIVERDLPEEIKPLVQSLNGLLGRLKQALDTQRTFVADAAHELRTPLAALQLQIQLAERAATDADRTAAFVELKEGLARASHLVQQLLTLARQEPNAAERALKPVALADVSRMVVAEQAGLAAQKRIDLGVTRDEPMEVAGDREALHTLLGNLVDNAIRYTPPGGTVDVAVYRDGSRAVLEVNDTGPGIPEEERTRVFDRFHRVTGSAMPGSGLGLAIVKRIADTHGATVELAGRPQGGTQVKVVFPHAVITAFRSHENVSA